MSDVIGVTGATGALGGLVIQHLLDRVPPERVDALVRDPAKAGSMPYGVEVRVADHDNPATLDQALPGIGVLLLISGNEFGLRMVQHRNVVDAAHRAGVGRLVYTSAPHADESDAFITTEHRATEELIRASGITYTMLRMNSWPENYLPHLQTGRQTGTIIGSVHNGRVASAAKTDYAEAAAVVLCTDGHDDAVYELTGDTAWNYPELAATISEVTGVAVRYQDLSSTEHAAALRGQGIDESTVEFLIRLDADLAAGVSAVVSDDLRRLIGRPTTPLMDGLRALVGGPR